MTSITNQMPNLVYICLKLSIEEKKNYNNKNKIKYMCINCKETKTIYYWSLLWSPPRYIYKMIGALKYIVDSFRQSNEKIIIIN